MPQQLDNTQLAYLEGFVKLCQDINVDPEQLLQAVSNASTPQSPKEQVQDVGAGALRGAGTGALLGGVVGGGIPMIIAAAYMARHPDLAGIIKLPDLAKLIVSGGITGAAGGAAAGAGIGGVASSVLHGKPSNSRAGATMQGMGRGALAGGAMGAAGGLLMPIAQLTALKSRGGNIGDIGAGNIAKAFGRSALAGAGAGALGGAGAGAVMGAAVGKTASAIQRIWDKMSMVDAGSLVPQPPQPKPVTMPAGAGVPPPSAPRSSGVPTNPIGGGMGAAMPGMTRTAQAKDDNVPDVTDRSDALEADEPAIKPKEKSMISPLADRTSGSTPGLTIPKLRKAQSSYSQRGIKI